MAATQRCEYSREKSYLDILWSLDTSHFPTLRYIFVYVQDLLLLGKNSSKIADSPRPPWPPRVPRRRRLQLFEVDRSTRLQAPAPTGPHCAQCTYKLLPDSRSAHDHHTHTDGVRKGYRASQSTRAFHTTTWQAHLGLRMKPSGDGCNPWGCNVDDDEATPCMIYTGVGKAGTYRECAVLNSGLFYEFHAWDRLQIGMHRPARAACERQRCNTFENRSSHATARRTIIMWQRGFKVLL